MPNIYNEVEGIFPDGKYTLVESSKQVDTLGASTVRVRSTYGSCVIDGTGKEFGATDDFQ